MRDIAIIGIDAATKAKNMGLACGKVTGEKCQLFEVVQDKNPVERIAGWMDGGPDTVLLAVDAPLGWPKQLGESLNDHLAGMPLGVPRHESNRLFRRHSDQVIKELVGKQPLDVGANFIARTAHSILCRLHELADCCTRSVELTLAWSPEVDEGCHLLEVYPAATLIALGANTRGYKRSDDSGRIAREAIVEKLRGELQIECPEKPLLANDDLLDAVVCVLAGFDFLRGLAVGPEKEEMKAATKEGWIWCRQPVKKGG